jgi:hypothetical protein
MWPTKTKKLSLESKIKRKKNIIRIEEMLGGDTLNEGDLDPPGSRRLLNAFIASMCVVCSFLRSLGILCELNYFRRPSRCLGFSNELGKTNGE